MNIRLAGRFISREELLEATETYEIIESYLEDKYLPSYLVWATSAGGPYHVLFAADVDGDNVIGDAVFAKVEALLSGVDASVELEIIPFAA